MRLFTFILSIYILLLTGIPCCAYDNCANESAQTEQHDSKKKEQKDCCDCGTCSPFFCHSCSGFIVTDFTLQLSADYSFTPKAYNAYCSPFHPQHITSCWQPPDLA